MAVQSPPIPPKQAVVKNVSPLKISPTPGKVSPMTSMPKTAVPSISTNPSTPVTQATPGVPGPPATSLFNKPEPRKRKWLWILLGIFGVIVVVAIVVGLYLGLS